MNGPSPRNSGTSPMADCIEWQGWRTRDGYGLTDMPGSPGRRTAASRATWMLAYGPIPEGMWVLHRCDNPPCVNLEHLFLGTPKDNAQDRAAKGRSAHNSPNVTGEANPRAILSRAQAREIVDLHRREGQKLYGRPRVGLTRAEIAVRFHVSKPTVDAILSGRNWKGVMP